MRKVRDSDTANSSQAAWRGNEAKRTVGIPILWLDDRGTIYSEYNQVLASFPVPRPAFRRLQNDEKLGVGLGMRLGRSCKQPCKKSVPSGI